MNDHAHDYERTLAASERHNWRVEDLIGGPRALDFGRRFLPEALARVEMLDFLTPSQRQVLNQIRGHQYLYMFGLVEEFILPFVLDHVRPTLNETSARTRAYLAFAAEEAKHIQLFGRFREEFVRGFPTPCEVIGPPPAIASAVLAKHPVSVALLILHIEWFVQRHWLECTRDDGDMDPLFKDLLRHHWMDEAQHVKLDTLMMEELALRHEQSELDRAVDGYLELGATIDELLQRQVAFDLAAFERATGRTLDAKERGRFEQGQLQANRWTYIGSGMTHPRFVATLERVSPRGAARVAALAPAFC